MSAPEQERPEVERRAWTNQRRRFRVERRGPRRVVVLDTARTHELGHPEHLVVATRTTVGAARTEARLWEHTFRTLAAAVRHGGGMPPLTGIGEQLLDAIEPDREDDR
ncbi:MAG: hypothetical protein ACRCZP_17430 [Phycicoccus sp.]